MAIAAAEAMKAALMPLGNLPIDSVEERLMAARRNYRLNLSYAGMTQVPPGFVEMVKKFNPHITELDLSSNNLTDLPDELEEFRYLRILRLKYNQLKRLPALVTRLPQLMTLELSGNQLTRVDDNIAAMQQLKELDLSGNMLSHLSDAIGSLPKLEVLELENNRLEILPDSIGDLPVLVRLDLSNNSLRFLPNTLGNYKRIQRMDVANNLLARVPPSIGHLKTLKEFNLRYNSLDDRYKAKTEEGLSRLLAFLREEEEREKLEEIERLKPIGTPVGAYLEYRCKAEVGQVVRTEVGEMAIDNRCWVRSGHSLTQVGNMLIVFGGTLLKDGSTTNDVFWMTLDRMEWHLQPCKGDKPPARFNHSAVFDADNNRLIVFGGRNIERKRLNDIYFLELDTFTWCKPACEGMPPSPREQSGVVFWAGNLVIFGGHAIGGRTNDLFLLDLSVWQWSQPPIAGTAPSPRQAAAIAIAHSNLLVVHGGRNNFVLEDLHILDFVAKSWVEVPAGGRAPPPRHSHLITLHKDCVYLFGGQDELGAQSCAMYRMHLPQGENYALFRPEWQEWESELPYNKNRTGVLFNGSLSLYQLGSNTLGRVVDEDAEKGLVYWDVFKTAKLDSLKPRQLDEEELKPKNAKRLRVQHTINISSKLPRSYVVQSAQEAKMLNYVQDYQSLFEELYPHRRRLYLTPRNECNVPKLVCTTVRPTQLSYSELYDVDGCCNFVADFLAYEPLEDPLHPPEFLPSPLSVLNWQAGDSFDMSVVLASLLIGVGYNAFIVMGYAPQAVTLNDQTDTTCPVLERETAAQQAPDKSEKQAATRPEAMKTTMSMRKLSAANGTEEKAAEPKKPKYIVKAGAVLESKFQKDQEAKRLAEEACAGVQSLSVSQEPSEEQQVLRAGSMHTIGSQGGAIGQDATPRQLNSRGEPVASAAQSRLGTASAIGMNADDDRQDSPMAATANKPQRCNTVHAWVLVMPGKRDVMTSFFIEPATGRRYAVDQSPYEGVEMLWNHQNVWVCMQMPLPHSDSRAHPKDISWELGDPAKWEALLEDRVHKRPIEAIGDEAELRALEAKTGPGGIRMSTAKSPMKPSTMASRTMGLAGTLQTPGALNATARSRAPTSMGIAPDCTPPRTAETAIDGGDGEEDGGEHDGVADMPPCWVPKLLIPRDAFDMRCPRGSKLTLYQRCQYEIFALFGDCNRYDGMVEKLVLYEDDDRTCPVEIRETFQRRKDRLRERRSYPTKDTIIEYFDAGSSYGVCDVLTVKNQKRVVNFYHRARLDGLTRREELEGIKMIETFIGRDDHLVYRSCTYLQGSNQEPAEDEDALGLRKGRAKESKKVLPIRKMTEKFARNNKVAADQDVAKRVFYLQEGRIHVDFHFGAGRITCSSHTFHKDGQSQIVQVDPLADRPQASALLEEYQQLLVAERDCMQAVRDSEWEVSEIIRTRTNQEQNIGLETPYYDVVRVKAEESEEEEEERSVAASDYLSPFLPPLSGMQQLTREQALEVREKCLKALKERLIERANIIQARLDEETVALGKRQQNYARDRDQLSQEEEEEYERAVEESMFRIQILEKRLKRHEEQALHKYYDLDHKLRADQRLAALLHM